MTNTEGRTTSSLLNKLREEPDAHARTLAAAIVSTALSREVKDIVDPTMLAKAFASGLRATAESEELEGWMEERASASLRWAHEHFEGTLEEHLSPEIERYLRNSAARPYRIDPTLLSSVLRHGQVRALVRDSLQDLLTSFGRSLTSAVFSTEQTVAFAGIMGFAKSITSMVRAEIDSQLEGRVKAFVDETLDRGIDKWTARLSTKKSALRMAESREQVASVLLEQPVRHYIRIPLTADVEAIARGVAEDIRMLAAWDGLETEISSGLESVLEPLEDLTLEELLEDSGLVQSWRGPIEMLLSTHLADLFRSEPFGAWLEGVEASGPRKSPARKRKKKQGAA